MYIHGEVHKFGYKIIDNRTGDIIYQAGNSPYDSQQVIHDIRRGLSTSKLIEYCNQTGNEIAGEQDKLYVGIHD